MPTTEEELQAKRERNEKLRDQIAAEQAKRHAEQTALASDVTAAELDAEGARLEAELSSVQRENDNLAAGASAPLDSARERMEQAYAAQKAEEDAAAKKAESDAQQGDKETPTASAVSPTPTTGEPEVLIEPQVTTTTTNTKGK